MPRWPAALLVAGLLLGGCGGASDQAPALEPVLEGEGLDQPSALAPRPGSDELWVANRGDDSITVITGASGERPRAVTRRDAYAEHFVARPAGLAFDRSGASFAVANDSNNELRDMVFVKNPERNRYFKGSNFMGPALFHSDTYALAGQSKRYLEDWPQPGWGHDPPDDTARHDCPDEYWSVEADACQWPREGSHVDMLHGSPLSVGILHDEANAYFLLDGCGTRTAANRCTGRHGHVVQVDFNRDHQEGNGFHGDGIIRRYVDAPFTRVAGVSSGMVRRDGAIYYADTGAGVVRRLDPDAVAPTVVVGPWHPGAATEHAHGPGVTDWTHAAHSPGDGDAPDVVERWVADHGDRDAIARAGERWIAPMETLGEYAYVFGAEGEGVVVDDAIRQPAGLAAGPDSLFVADHASGRVHELAWDGLEQRRVIDTGLEGLDALAYVDGLLYLTDIAAGAVYRVDLR